jgi:hypothetical protein
MARALASRAPSLRLAAALLLCFAAAIVPRAAAAKELLVGGRQLGWTNGARGACPCA